MTLPLEVPEPLFDCRGSSFGTTQLQRSEAVKVLPPSFSEGVLPQTAFRKWEFEPSMPKSVSDGPVPGLRCAFKEAGLASYDRLAESWCCDNGAAFLDELIEFEDELGSRLGLEPQLRVRLHQALVAHLDSDSDGDTGVDGPHVPASATCANSLPICVATGSPEQPLVLTVSPVAPIPVARSHATSCTSLLADGPTQTVSCRPTKCKPTLPMGLEEGPVPGLRDAFARAGLAHFCDAAESWCHENGAAFVCEVIAEVECLCAAIGLASYLRERLHVALVICDSSCEEMSGGEEESCSPAPASSYASHHLATPTAICQRPAHGIANLDHGSWSFPGAWNCKSDVRLSDSEVRYQHWNLSPSRQVPVS